MPFATRNPRSTETTRRRRLLAGIVLCLAAMSTTTPATAQAQPDVIYVVSGQVQRIPHARLLANDTFVGEPQLTIEQPASHGVITTYPGFFDYDPGDRPQGGDQLSVRLTHAGGSSTAVVRVIILPELIPVSGRWPTEKAHTGLPCSDGDGAEIGFYLPAQDHFILCDFDGQEMNHCVAWRLPVADLPDTAEGLDVAPRLPIFGDWDLDGWDEPALYDPATAELATFDYGSSCGRGLMCLVPGAVHPTNLSSLDYPLFGTWAPAEPAVLAGFDWLSQQISGGLSAGMQLPLADDSAMPIVGDWQGEGRSLLARWQPTSNQVHYLIDTSGLGSASMAPQVSNPGSAANIGFAGRRSRCSDETYFGVFQMHEAILGLFELSTGSHSRPPVHVKVPIDPDIQVDGDGDGADRSRTESSRIDTVTSQPLR